MFLLDLLINILIIIKDICYIYYIVPTYLVLKYNHFPVHAFRLRYASNVLDDTYLGTLNFRVFDTKMCIPFI